MSIGVTFIDQTYEFRVAEVVITNALSDYADGSRRLARRAVDALVGKWAATTTGPLQELIDETCRSPSLTVHVTAPIVLDGRRVRLVYRDDDEEPSAYLDVE